MKKIFREYEINEVFARYREEIKGVFAYGTEYNDFKIDSADKNQLGQKGWITICQQLSICDAASANRLLKQQLRDKGNTFTQDEFQ